MMPQVMNRLENLADEVELLTVLNKNNQVEYADFLNLREIWDYYSELKYEADVNGTAIGIKYDKRMLGYVIQLG